MKLSEFGLSKQCNAGDFDDGSTYDALLYQAPEVFKDGTGLKSDVWSLGISIIEMAENKHPFAKLTSLQVMKKVFDGEPPSLSSSEWSSDLVDFVSRCLVKDANARSSVDDLLKVSAVYPNDA